jgi:chromate transporter
MEAGFNLRTAPPSDPCVIPAAAPSNAAVTPTLRELARVFLRISLLGFGGPNAHLALMLDEVVDRRGWISREHFLQLVGITNLLPGPNSSEVAIHIGYTQRGWRGALATGLAFLTPTFLLVLFFSYLYFRFGTLPQVEGIFWGLKPAVLAVILAAGWKLARTALERPDTGRSAIQRPLLAFLALAGVATSLLLDRWEVGAMAVGGLLGWALLRDPGVRDEPREQEMERPRSAGGFLLLPAAVSASLPALPSVAAPLAQLFGLTLGLGAVLFGGGYMLVALLEPFVVGAHGWLTPQQFLDGVALTQAIPGPIVTLVAFVGFAVAGIPGSVVATAGIYLPSFGAVLLVAPALERWRHLESMGAALRGVNAVVAGAILGVGISLIPPALEDVWGGGILFLSLAILVRFRLKALWIVAGGIVAGLLHVILGV